MIELIRLPVVPQTFGQFLLLLRFLSPNADRI